MWKFILQFAIIYEPSATVTGLIYRDVPDSAWRRLDVFEGSMYRRSVVTVQLSDGDFLESYTYVLKEEHQHQLSSFPWDFDTFLRRGKHIFESQYFGFEAIEDSGDGIS